MRFRRKHTSLIEPAVFNLNPFTLSLSKDGNGFDPNGGQVKTHRLNIRSNAIKAFGILLLVFLFCLRNAYARVPLHGYEYNIRASSVLVDHGIAYKPENIKPPSLSRAWCEGTQGNGIGEWVEIIPVRPIAGGMRLAILPGYQKSSRTFVENARPKVIDIFINNRFNQKIEIHDAPVEQSFELTPPTGEDISRILMTITDVYPGSKYMDACITEVLLFPRGDLEDKFDARDAEHEAKKVAALFKDAQAGKLEAIEELMRMTEGAYIRTAEGSEWLREIYLDLFVHNSDIFLFVALKQEETIKLKVLNSIVIPISDKYTTEKLIKVLDAVKGIDMEVLKNFKNAILSVTPLGAVK